MFLRPKFLIIFDFFIFPIINFFTKENEYVLDYFMGVGGTLLGASLSNRNALGIDQCRHD